MSKDKWPWGRSGDHQKGEISLLGDVDAPERWQYRNPYIAIRTDPVRFPGPRDGSYFSLHRPSGAAVGGVAMLPMFRGAIVLSKSYRHAPRRWMVELPRGMVEAGEAPEAAAARELREEYAVGCSAMRPLGVMNPDSGTFAFDVGCFYCELEALPELVGDDYKCPPVVMSQRQLMAAIASGDVADGFTGYCILSALARGYISWQG